MPSINQNNKIAIAAIAIFFVSFSVMIFWMDSEDSSPDYVKSDVLQAAMGQSDHREEASDHGGGHSPYFSETEDDTSTHERDLHEVDDSHGRDSDLENMYRVLIDNFDKPYFVLYPEGKVKYFSEDFVDAYDYGSSDLGKENFFSLLNAEDLPEFATEYTQVIHTGKSLLGVGPYRLETTAGGSFVHLVNLIPVVDDNGNVTEVIGVVKDITEKVEDFGDSIEEKVSPEESVETEVEAETEIRTEDADHHHSELWYKSLIGGNFS